MGTIALYDADMHKYKQTVFNLELMKLSSYYKNKRQIVNHISKIEPTKYTQFIYRKDYNDGDFPSELLQDNVSYGGLAFSNNIYIPLENSQEDMVPDVSIYDAYKKYFSTYELNLMFRTLMSCFHTRLSLDGQSLWDKSYQHIDKFPKSKTIILHDYNINKIPGAFESCLDIQKYCDQGRSNIRYIGFKFPLYITEVEELFQWLNLPLSNNFCALDYQGFLTDEVLDELIKRDLLSTKKLSYDLTNFLYPVEDFYQNILPIVYKQILFCRKYGKKMLLKYDKNSPNITQGQKDLFKVLNSFVAVSKLNRKGKYKQSLYDYVVLLDECSQYGQPYATDKRKARNAFLEVYQYNPELFNDFYRKSLIDIRSGKITYV